MKWKKRLKITALVLFSASLIMVYLANRDLTRIYGGLTDRVDTRQFTPLSGPIAIQNVNVLAPDASRFLSNRTVVIDDGKIVAVESASSTPDSMQLIDAQGKFLIPGLTDAHVHLFKSPNDLLLYLATGVTQIQELIGEEDHLEWRREIQNGRIGPEMFIASPRIGSFEPLEGFFMEWSQGFLNITTADQARTEVKRLHEQGYDAVKIYSQINQEAYAAVTETAKSLGMKVVGHVPWSLEMTDIYPNQHSVAHLEELMNAMNREFGGFRSKSADEFISYVEKRSEVIAKELLANEIAVTTTLWLVESFVRQKFDLDTVLNEVELEYENPGISEWTPRIPQGGLGWLPEVNRYQIAKDLSEERKIAKRTYWDTYTQACQIILRSLIKHNVTVVTGTDANLPPTVPGFSLHDEFISLNKAGMSPAQILKSATINPAHWLNNNAGVIAPGRKANLLLLDKNPLADIRNTKTINSVVVNGRLLNRSLLDQMLAAVKAANDASRTVDIDTYVH